MAENLKAVAAPPDDQDLIVDTAHCYKSFADMQICFGNLAPDGIVFKVSSMKDPVFEGTAVCFDDPWQIVKAVEERQTKPSSMVSTQRRTSVRTQFDCLTRWNLSLTYCVAQWLCGRG
jgi:dihydroxy-acid dehydratase